MVLMSLDPGSPPGFWDSGYLGSIPISLAQYMV